MATADWEATEVTREMTSELKAPVRKLLMKINPMTDVLEKIGKAASAFTPMRSAASRSTSHDFTPHPSLHAKDLPADRCSRSTPGCNMHGGIFGPRARRVNRPRLEPAPESRWQEVGLRRHPPRQRANRLYTPVRVKLGEKIPRPESGSSGLRTAWSATRPTDPVFVRTMMKPASANVDSLTRVYRGPVVA